jgi:PAS domain S-box-containing protein
MALEPPQSLPANLAALVAAKDWSETLLGSSDKWSPSLTAAVRFVLACGFPMAVRWGPDFVLIYNDGYREILGDKHPRALGLPFRDVWPEVQPVLGPLHQSILLGKRGPTFSEDLLLRIQRYGERWEDARFTISYSPIPDETAISGVGGVLITAVETTNRVAMEEALKASEERFARIFDQTSVGVIECSLEGDFLLANKRFCEIFGRGPEELETMRMRDVIHPDDRADHDHRLRQLIEEGLAFTVERRFLRPDGATAWVSSNITATRDADGTPLRIICVVQDITERHQLQEQQGLLLQELNHRVKNLFMVASSMISLSARTAATPADLAANLRGRLDALAAAHDLVLPQGAKLGGQRVALDVLVRKLLLPYLADDPGQDRVVIDGSPLEVGARAVEGLALVLHELATNAAKYGALSVPDGAIHISWRIAAEALQLCWQEKNGPGIAAAPSKGGFGTTLSNQSVRGQFGGTLTHAWNPDGLVVDLSIPLARLAS